MTKNSLVDIRKEFLDFFKHNNHEIIQSSALVPINDDSLLFTNAGMVQFKNIFTGIEPPPKNGKAVTAQKCVRAGGKHNDLENVGLTKRHHTFFEMLGNFSFGNYFKEEAIELAWKLITKNFYLKEDKIIVTVYDSDEEAFNLWKKISSLSEHKILKISNSDNFWEMGETGPCGPCSEIFYDHGKQYSGGMPGSDNEGDRYVEIWNLVFMQYNKFKSGEKELLPKPSIDTGMGIERMAAVLQGKADNYEIDLFRNLIDKIKDVFSIKENEKSRVPLRIISDHLRAVSFLIADGVLPSNEGRGYVLRRILRRAIRHIYNLEIKKPIFFKLVPIIIEEMGNHYIELFSYKELISKTIEFEENKFLETLEKGLKILEEEDRKSKGKKIFSGKVAFKLYDTFGFPLDLTADVLKAKKKNINIEEFNKEMNYQKELSKKSWKGEDEKNTDKEWSFILEKFQETEFIGYDDLEIASNITKITFGGKDVQSFSEKNKKVSLFFDKTSFYAEGGGQIGDSGIIRNENFLLDVIDTRKRLNKYYEHICFLREGTINLGEKAFLKVNMEKRNKTAAHHSATHLLHSSLRKILGEHVTQKGSLVTDKKLRFDISHNKPLETDIIMKIEIDVNNQIQGNFKVNRNILDKKEAIEKGAMAIFGEKYGKKVRVIEMGKNVENGEKPFSIELCGGTHVKNTGEIGMFKILSEGSLASGIRRIEAVAGIQALEIYQRIENNLKSISNLLKTDEKRLFNKIDSIVKQNKDLEKKLRNNNNQNLTTDNLEKLSFKSLNIYSKIFDELDPKQLKKIIDVYKNRNEKNIIILLSKNDNKVTTVVGVTEEISKKFSAVNIINHMIPVLGGNGGGGRETLAQGGGNKIENASQAISSAINYIKSEL